MARTIARKSLDKIKQMYVFLIIDIFLNMLNVVITGRLLNSIYEINI